MKTSVKLASVALLSTLALTACGGNDEGSSSPKPEPSSSSSATPSPSPLPPEPAPTSEAPATSQEMKTPYFTSVAPAGWDDVSEQAKAGSPLALIAFRSTDTTPFADNVNIVRVQFAKDFTKQELIAQFKKELVQSGAKLQGEPQALTVDGAPAYSFHSVATTTTGVKVNLYQVQMTKDGYSYVATSTASKDADAKANIELATSNWKWTS